MVLSIGGKNSPPYNLSLFGISAIVSNASFASAGTAAPSSIASLFGNGFGLKSQTTGFPGTAFQGVSVVVNGTPAPLFHLSVSASQNQIDFLMPTELPADLGVTRLLWVGKERTIESFRDSSRSSAKEWLEKSPSSVPTCGSLI